MGIGIKANRYNPEKVILTKLTSDATATQSNIDNGKTAYVNGTKITGTSTKVDTSEATAAAEDILSGKTAFVNGMMLTGSLEKGMKVVTGSKKGGGKTFSVSGLSFRPKGIYICYSTTSTLATLAYPETTMSYFYDSEQSIGGQTAIINNQSYPSGKRVTSSNVTITDTSISVSASYGFNSTTTYGYIVWGE